MKTDKDWNYYGKKNPYYGVFTVSQYDNLNEKQIKENFFHSGELYTQKILSWIESDFKDFNIQSASVLDFGCGVGRVVLPLSKKFKNVCGIDISKGMLEEAVKNCKEQNIDNCVFDTELTNVKDKFDLVHSIVVFQHIPTKIGFDYFNRLIDLLNNDGIGVLHFTYSQRFNTIDRFKYFIYRNIPGIYQFRNFILKRPFMEPMMQMNLYNLNKLFKIFQEKNCHKSIVRYTNHNENLGVIILFQKKELEIL